MRTLESALSAIRERLASAKTNTDAQRSWAVELANAEKLIVQTIDLRKEVAAFPEDQLVRRRAAIRQGQAKLAIEKILRGEKSYRANYEAAHGGTPEERRANWREAKREAVLKKEGRVARMNKRRADMTPEEWDAHVRERRRKATAEYRGRKLKS